MTTVIIGVGTEYRRDDAVGIVAIRRLRALHRPGVVCAESDGEPTSLIDLWDQADLAIVVDGVRGPGEPGHLYRISLHHPAATGRGGGGTHAASLGDAVALGRALRRMPRRLLLYGVQVADVSPGQGLTPCVEAAVGTVVAEIAEMLQLQPKAVL